MSEGNGQDRRVYKNQCGPCAVVADPVRLWRRLSVALQGDIDEPLQKVQGPPDGQKEAPGEAIARLEAEERLAEAARQAFELPPFDGGQGPNEGELLELLYHYLDWLGEKKTTQTSSETPTSRPSTAPVS